MQLGHEIRAARGARTRREFGDVFGVTELTVWKWETGRAVPTDLGTIAALIEEGVPSEAFGPQVVRLVAAVVAPWTPRERAEAFA